jgi:hypothetical protein
MQQCVQQHELFVPFLKTIKLMMVLLYLKFLSHLCRKVCFSNLILLRNFLRFILEYSEKIPYVKEAPVEQEAKPATAAKKK